MKKIITIFICLFFNITFSSSYHESMKRIQCFRNLNPQTKMILREHAAEQIAELFEKYYLEIIENANKEGIHDLQDMIKELITTFDIILKKNKSFSVSILELKKSKVYKNLITKHPEIKKPTYQAIIEDYLSPRYQNYHSSFIMKDNK